MTSSLKKPLKHLWLVALASLGYLLLLPAWVARRRRRQPEFRVLTYHSVSSRRRHETNVSPAAFASHMKFLARHARVCDLLDLLQPGPAARNGADGHPLVAVTFDDGYADTAREALPILRRHAFPATCFVVAGLVGGETRLAHDRGEAENASRILSWAEVRELAGAGVRVGSHMLSHSRAGNLDDTGLRREIFESKRLLEETLGQHVSLISYPYGRATDFDARAETMVRAAGYLGAATAMYGWNHVGKNPFRLRRIGVESSDTLFTLRAKLNGALDVLALMEGPHMRRIVSAVNRRSAALGRRPTGRTESELSESHGEPLS